MQLDAKGEAGVRALLPNIYLLGVLLYNKRIAAEKITCGPVSTFNGIGNIVHESNSSLYPSKSPNSETTETQAVRNVCDECSTATATCQCTQCEGTMYCEKCYKKVHSASKLLMKHTPLPIEDTGDKGKLMCPIHNGRKLEFYDKNMGEAVCAICIISERCRGHDVVLLSDFTSESEGEVVEAVDKAKDTLFWWNYSVRALSKELPVEYMEAEQLFCEIQATFQACHALLQRRNLELMEEAAQKIVSDGSVQQMLQQLTAKKKTLDSLLKDVEMVMKDKTLFQIKADDYLLKLKEFADEPCIVRRKSCADDDITKLIIHDEIVDNIEKMGTLKAKSVEKFVFQKADEVADDVKDELKNNFMVTTSSEAEKCVEKNDIIVEEDLNNKLRRCSLLTGYNELVCVTDITNPLDFKVQRLADKDRLQVLMQDLNQYCRNQKTNATENLIYSVEEGQLLCAQYLADQNWYRVRVINKINKDYPDAVPSWSNNLTIQVVYIDYGNQEWLPLNRLRRIPKQFLQVPEMAVSCSLTGIVPPCQGEEWPERSKKALATMTGDRPMLMNIQKRVGCTLQVDLRRPEDDDRPTRDDDRPASVRDSLVFLEVACFLSPASFPNSDLHQSRRKYKPHEALIEGGFMDVLVTHIEDPQTIFVQKLSSKIAEEQIRLSHVYNARNKKAWLVDYPYRNFVCAAKFSADKSWYRAQVLNVNVDDTVEVEYVDYGNREILPFSDLRRIPDMYLEMSQQCVKVKMYGLELPEGEETWNSESLDFLQKFILGKSLVAVVKSVDEDNDSAPSVELYDTSTDNDVNMNLLVQQFISKPNLNDVSKTDTSAEQELTEVVPSTESPSYPRYLPAVLPAASLFSSSGVFVDDEANIFLHYASDDTSAGEDVTTIMRHLNVDTDVQRFENALKSTQELQVGQGVIAKFSQDELWYRVKIVKIIDESNALVHYIDFGNNELANVCSIYPKAMFAKVGAKCIGVQLADAKPLNGEDRWSTQMISLLREYVVNENVTVDLKTRNMSGDFNKADLFINGDTSLRDLLVEQKLIEAVEPIISPPSAPHDSPYLWYTKQKLPKRGLKFDVVVPQINQPDIIFIQRIPDIDEAANDDTLEEAYNNIQILESVGDQMNEEGFFDRVGLSVEPIVGMACIAKYSQDELFYRARIEKLDQEEGVAEVNYVDWGTSETVPIESLITMPESLISLPMQATKVCVAGIVPVPPPDDQDPALMIKGTEWTFEAMKYFYSLTADKRLVAQVLDADDEVPQIHLYERMEKEGTVEYVSIAERMNLANFSV